MRLVFSLIAGFLFIAQVGAVPPSDLYYVVFLRPDPARKTLPKAEGDKLQAAHMANIHKMADDGILVAAGPFDDEPVTISGIFLFKAASLDAAQKVAERDPTVLAHRNSVDTHPWRGPAGIGVEYFRMHKEHPDTPENMQARTLCLIYRNAGWNDGSRAAHETYVERLRSQGKLGAAGAMEGDRDKDALVGMVIFQVMPAKEAQALLHDDPAVKSGAVRVEFHQWWSADHVLPW
jgi:uncharacterized protein YciI